MRQSIAVHEATGFSAVIEGDPDDGNWWSWNLMLSGDNAGGGVCQGSLDLAKLQATADFVSVVNFMSLDATLDRLVRLETNSGRILLAEPEPDPHQESTESSTLQYMVSELELFGAHQVDRFVDAWQVDGTRVFVRASEVSYVSLASIPTNFEWQDRLI